MIAPAFDQPNTWEEMLLCMRYRFMNISGERLGQAYFNALANAWPELADLVRGTSADPFYADNLGDPRMQKFFETIIPYFVSS